LLQKLLNLQKPQIKIKLLSHLAKIPKYAHPGDSGFDLASVKDITIRPKETVLIPTGLSFEIPQGLEIQVRPRSGTSLKTPLRVVNSPGTVDSSYTGEIKVIMQNIGEVALTINAGDRIAQGVICPVICAEFIVSQDLEITTRGEQGFGSSGTN
jgi:dUTP pyrophosphatase